MLPAVVFAIYRVAVENQPAFMGVVQEKLDFFHKMKYRTGRDPILLRSKNDPEIIIDIFEWLNFLKRTTPSRISNRLIFSKAGN
jgi:hypothetical protein